MRISTLGMAVAALVSFVQTERAGAEQPLACVKEYIAKRATGRTFSITLSDVEFIVDEVSRSIGLSSQAVTIVECAFDRSRAYAWSPGADLQGVPFKNYIIYDPVWINEVSQDKVQSTFIFGHELAHFLNSDFTARIEVARLTKETEADHFGGCAVAKVVGRESWPTLQLLLERIRPETDGIYPSKEHSKQVALSGFLKCGGRLEQLVKSKQVDQFGKPSSEDDSVQGLDRWLAGQGAIGLNVAVHDLAKRGGVKFKTIDGEAYAEFFSERERFFHLRTANISLNRASRVRLERMVVPDADGGGPQDVYNGVARRCAGEIDSIASDLVTTLGIMFKPVLNKVPDVHPITKITEPYFDRIEPWFVFDLPGGIRVSLAGIITGFGPAVPNLFTLPSSQRKVEGVSRGFRCTIVLVAEALGQPPSNAPNEASPRALERSSPETVGQSSLNAAKSSAEETFLICVGEDRLKCEESAIWQPCGASVTGWLRNLHPNECRLVNEVRLWDQQGGRCGYKTIQATCIP